MSRVAVVYWSGTGNTAAMAEAVAEGAKAAGAEVDILGPSQFTPAKAEEYDGVALGCPAMGAEQLEETEFQPMWDAVVPVLTYKRAALFGSWGWGGGEWMHTWEGDCEAAGIHLVCDSVICMNAPDDTALAECRALGGALA